MSVYYVECEQCGFHDWQPDDVAAIDQAQEHEQLGHTVFAFLEVSGVPAEEIYPGGGSW